MQILVREGVTKIHLVFANEQMLKRESKLYSDCEGVLDGKVLLKLCVPRLLKLEQITKHQAVVFDEADVALFDY